MHKPFEKKSDPDPSVAERAATESKKVYRTPRLVTYGNVRDLALGAGGGKSDGVGPPRSRA